ncbi:threonine synthase [Weissella thailandensis]|uniref:Threonine synthase n=1 Tax=Weissella thailandensis TaxID=89061 RepID=A0ABX9I4G8_9LACO|nr:threonine synthase [Weissella thailandensis]NKY91481.1 threonine synthase [Weissella thailandensis]RDS59020.1 threonine synthase [Weissella thailandensis]GEP75065.1 threonine synthase [Weissella thailandensis]
MKRRFVSTRGRQQPVSAKTAVKQGLAIDHGLFVDPNLGQEKINLTELLPLDYQQLAQNILYLLLPDFTPTELTQAVHNAYYQNFDTTKITPLHTINDCHVLELWHGPTSAFKDIGLQLLPHLMQLALEKNEHSLVLTATSGDTGKAALEGFKNINNVGISVFYPEGGVSDIQEKQMLTTAGENTSVAAITGNFDDAQRHVKEIFTNETFKETLANDLHLSSANSINVGRLAPQVVYYFSAYQQLVKQGEIAQGDFVNFTVPTGNFGDVLAGYYAKLLGLPIKKLIVVANANNVLTDFFKTGIYDRQRPFLHTVAPSMDIQVSSNLERLLYYESGLDSAYIDQLMNQLETNGHYQVSDKLLQNLQRDFACGFSSDHDIQIAIKEVYEEQGYLMDPHTAAGYHVMRDYQKHDQTPMILLATASPYKFVETTAPAILPDVDKTSNSFDLIQRLADYTNTPVPDNLARLHDLPIRHKNILSSEKMQTYVKKQAEVIFNVQNQSACY